MLSSGVFPTFPRDSNTGHIVLLIIDPQVDFHEGGSLQVTGATADAKRIYSMIERCAPLIGQIFVTMDSHHRNHIAHSSFWFTPGPGEHAQMKDLTVKAVTKYATTTVYEPNPFTIIKHEHIRPGMWLPVDQSLREHCETYTQALENPKDEFSRKMKLTIWPEHCLIGRPGHCVQPDIYEGIKRWECATDYQRSVYYIYKGSNNLTEMYSAIRAEVPIENDPSTQTNDELLQYLWQASQVIICGQARSHCVNYTVRDILKEWKDRSDPDELRNNLSRIVLLNDGMSDVGGFSAVGEEFIEQMREEGMTIAECSNVHMVIANRSFR